MATLSVKNPIRLSSNIKNIDANKTTIIIRQLRSNDQLAWDEYVKSHSEGCFFHLTGWKNVIEKSFGHKSCYLLAERPTGQTPDLPADFASTARFYSIKDIGPSKSTSSIVGILPLFFIKSFLFGKFAISVPYAETGGALANSIEIEDLLTQRAVEITQNQSLDYLELRCKDRLINGFVLKELYYNFKREIFDDLDQNLKEIPRKSRRMIRQGEKFNLSFQFGNHNIKTFYNILTRSFHNLGTPPFAYKFFENICAEFKESCLILIVLNEDKLPISGVLTFLYKDQVIPYYAGSLVEYRKLAPNDFMYWQLMKYGCENNYRVFDFGRSKEGTGSFHFKRHWGFEPKPLHYQYYLNKVKEMPNLSPANPKYHRKIELWKRLPLWVTQAIGPYISKYLA